MIDEIYWKKTNNQFYWGRLCIRKDIFFFCVYVLEVLIRMVYAYIAAAYTQRNAETQDLHAIFTNAFLAAFFS